jgi:uncharacterized caspase-like protein
MVMLGQTLAVVAVCLAVGCANKPPNTAWVIGNGGYEHSSPLPNPTNDAKAVSAALKQSGWAVETLLDATAEELSAVADRAALASAGSQQSLLFYAGHGMQIDGHNYMVPVDFDPAGESPLDHLIPLDGFLDNLIHPGTQLVVILDACRNNPMSDSLTAKFQSARGLGLKVRKPRSVGRGLAEVATSAGTFIAFATEPGNVALDGEGTNSPFTSALIRHIGAPGEEIGRVLQRVRKDVIDATDGNQIPWDHSSLTEPFRIRKAERKPVPP